MTAPKSRPGPELLDEERYAGLLGDAIDALEAFQVPTPHAGLEGVIGTVRFVRDNLVKQAAVKLLCHAPRPAAAESLSATIATALALAAAKRPPEAG